MRHTFWIVAALVAVASPPAAAEERVAGTIVAASGETYTVELGDELGISPGSVLRAYRRLPSTRGSAAYRQAAVWWDVGELTVTAVSGGVAFAHLTAPPDEPLPAGLDESGAPAGEVQVGDRVRATGALDPLPAGVRVTFATTDLFSAEQLDLKGDGRRFFRRWLRGLQSVEGPIEIEVHPRLAELEPVGPDLSRSLSLDADAPHGPAPGEPVVPVEQLYEGAPSAVPVPEGREVHVVQRSGDKPDVWQYVDPITLAHRRGERIAAALSAHLRVPKDQILVRVVPRPPLAEGDRDGTPGYDSSGDQLRILAAGISWSEPPPPQPPKPKTEDPLPELPPLPEPEPRRRRILEKMPEDVS